MTQKAKNRMTTQRLVILDELRKTTSHPTADELYRKVKKRLPMISLATVYRNLEVLSRLGKIRRLDAVGGQRRFDADLTEHYHVRCIRCGRVDDLYISPRINMDNGVRSVNRFRILGHRLEFLGICPGCVKNEDSR
jgi:Fur family ferric uptake transcriptional regulator